MTWRPGSRNARKISIKRKKNWKLWDLPSKSLMKHPDRVLAEPIKRFNSVWANRALKTFAYFRVKFFRIDREAGKFKLSAKIMNNRIINFSLSVLFSFGFCRHNNRASCDGCALDATLLDECTGSCPRASSGHSHWSIVTGFPTSLSRWLQSTICNGMFAAALFHFPIQQSMCFE